MENSSVDVLQPGGRTRFPPLEEKTGVAGMNTVVSSGMAADPSMVPSVLAGRAPTDALPRDRRAVALVVTRLPVTAVFFLVCLTDAERAAASVKRAGRRRVRVKPPRFIAALVPSV